MVASDPPPGKFDSMCTAMPYGESSGVSASFAIVDTSPDRETARTQLLE
jgi:hypothetical protein